MPIRIIFNNKEVEHPLIKLAIGLFSLIGLVVFSALLIFIILPLIGITVAVTFGIFITVFLAVFLSVLVTMLLFGRDSRRS